MLGFWPLGFLPLGFSGVVTAGGADSASVSATLSAPMVSGSIAPICAVTGAATLPTVSLAAVVSPVADVSAAAALAAPVIVALVEPVGASVDGSVAGVLDAPAVVALVDASGASGRPVRGRRPRNWVQDVPAETVAPDAAPESPPVAAFAPRPELPASLVRLVDVPADPELLRAADRLDRAADALIAQRIDADAAAMAAAEVERVLQAAADVRRRDDEDAAMLLLLW